MIEDRVLITVK